MKISKNKTWTIVLGSIISILVLLTIGIPFLNIELSDQDVNLEEVSNYCLEKDQVGKYGDNNGGFCCEDLYPVLIKGTDKYVCNETKDLKELNLVSSYSLSKIDDQRSSAGKVVLEISKEKINLEAESIFLISSTSQEESKKKKRKIKKSKVEVRKALAKCKNIAKQIVDKQEEKKITKKQKRRLNSCYKLLKQTQKENSNNNWENWKHLAKVTVNKNDTNKYVVKYEDASGKCEREYILDDSKGQLVIEYIDFSKDSKVKGYCDQKGQARSFRASGGANPSIQYVIFEVGKNGQELTRVDGPIALDGITTEVDNKSAKAKEVSNNLFPKNVVPSKSSATDSKTNPVDKGKDDCKKSKSANSDNECMECIDGAYVNKANCTNCGEGRVCVDGSCQEIPKCKECRSDKNPALQNIEPFIGPATLKIEGEHKLDLVYRVLSCPQLSGTAELAMKNNDTKDEMTHTIGALEEIDASEYPGGLSLAVEPYVYEAKIPSANVPCMLFAYDAAFLGRVIDKDDTDSNLLDVNIEAYVDFDLDYKKHEDFMGDEPRLPISPFDIINGGFYLNYQNLECSPEGLKTSISTLPLGDRKTKIINDSKIFYENKERQGYTPYNFYETVYGPPNKSNPGYSIAKDYNALKILINFISYGSEDAIVLNFGEKPFVYEHKFPITTCVHISGKQKGSINFMSLRSASISEKDHPTDRFIYDNYVGIKQYLDKTPPFSEYSEHITLRADVGLYDKVKRLTRCQMKDLHSSIISNKVPSGKGVAGFGSNSTDINPEYFGSDTPIHEIGHSFCGLGDEYNYEDYNLHKPFIPPNRNCASSAGAFGTYGDSVVGCSTSKFFRPSQKSLLNADSNKDRHFNVVGCGWCLVEISKAIGKQLDKTMVPYFKECCAMPGVVKPSGGCS